MSYENQLIREATEGPTWQEVHEDHCEHDCGKCGLHFSDCVCLEEATPETTMPGIEMACEALAKQLNRGETLSRFADRIIADDGLCATAKNGDRWTGEKQDGHFIYCDQQGNLYESSEAPAYRLPITVNRYSEQTSPQILNKADANKYFIE